MEGVSARDRERDKGGGILLGLRIGPGVLTGISCPTVVCRGSTSGKGYMVEGGLGGKPTAPTAGPQ